MLLKLHTIKLALVAPSYETISIPSKTMQQQPLLDHPNDPNSQFKNSNLHNFFKKRATIMAFFWGKRICTPIVQRNG